MTQRIHAVEAETKGDFYVVTIRGPRRKVLLRETFISEKIGRSFYDYCTTRMAEQD